MLCLPSKGFVRTQKIFLREMAIPNVKPLKSRRSRNFSNLVGNTTPIILYGGRFGFKRRLRAWQNGIGNSIRFGSQQSEVHHIKSTKKKNKKPRTPRVSEKSTSKADFHGAKSNPHSRTSSTTREAFGDKSYSSLNIVQVIKKTISEVFRV